MTYPCPKCDSILSRVTESRAATSHKRRRRECLNPECKHRFTTWETKEKPSKVEVVDVVDELENIHYECLSLEQRIYTLLFETFPDRIPSPAIPNKPNICNHNNSGIEL